MAHTQTTDLGPVLIILSLLHSGSGKLEINTTDSLMEVLMGHNVTIPCHLSGYKSSLLDLSMVSVLWTLNTLKEEKLVYMFSGGRHTPERPGSHIPDSGVQGGDASLHLPNLQFSDEGEYTCSVIVTPDKATSKVTLQISAKPTCSVSDSRLEMNPNADRSVTCYVNGFHPEAVKIQWVKTSQASSSQSELNSRTCTTVPVLSQDGTYNVTSVLSVKPMSTEEDGDVYSCGITHRSLRDVLTCNVTLSVQPEEDKKTNIIIGTVLGIFLTLMTASAVFIYILFYKTAPPEVLDFIGPELINMKMTTLACPIVHFRPKYIKVSLYLRKNEEKTFIESWDSKTIQSERNTPLLMNRSELTLKCFITPAKNGVFSCICSISLTPNVKEHNGVVLIMEVEHKTLKSPACKELMLAVKAPPVLDPIDANQDCYNMGDHLVLTCRIHSFFPQNIKVIWYKGEEPLPSPCNNPEADGNGFFSVTGCMSCTVIEGDFGKIFRCKVEHPCATDRDEGVAWTLQRKVIEENNPQAIDGVNSSQGET